MNTSALLGGIACLSSLGLASVPMAQDAADDELLATVEQLGWDLTDRYHVPGVAVTVFRGGRVAWFLGCGYADKESETEVTEDTVFNIGSISKTVAAWGVMRLVEQGKLELDAPVEKTLTRWHLPASEFDANEVTLRRLLSHTAGLSLHGYPGFQPEEELPTIEESLSGATNGSGAVFIAHEPGSKWQYSGGGYTIAQLLVEEVTGMTFAEYMRANVLLPLGMEHSDYRWTAEIDELAATPYDGDGAPFGGPRFTAQAAASLQVSSADMARFALASMPNFAPADSPHLLKPETIALMQSPAPASDSYGLGYQTTETGGHRVVGHGGSNQGWQAQLHLVPDTGDGILILTNGSAGQSVINAIEKAWADSLPWNASQSSAGSGG